MNSIRTKVYSEPIKGFDGILFIGDLHLASGKVGRRIDDYAAAVLRKLSQAARICNERNLFPVGLGDLFHRARENNLELLAQVMAAFREFKLPPGVLPEMLGGSHDRTESWFTHKDAAYLMANAGVLNLIDQPGKVLSLDIKGTIVNLWATPAGFRIPASIAAEPGTRNIMVTHEDFDFNGLYPDGQELKEIEGCDMLVNGHMHTPCPMVLKGRMACHNPGSVSRVSVDLKKHKPVVSVWTPAHGISLESVPLEFAEDVFDLTGKEVYAAAPGELKAALPKGLRLSSFASKLRETDTLEAGRTDDGSVMVEELEEYFSMFEKPGVLKTFITSLLEEVVEERQKKAA
ncbi:phosphoesterase [Novimethylophilus kurashikiensis]|uniref:Phosphoesterase n=1 Tax=Novimethylophilus kurashikiensis TaxID=1825523 RepID=A0A2R5F877_9PROT|nr:metallophosphoesterase [Novimethylophilus kurashikiensis]GBG14450.1 phosphoesterase [Novimethylophilus kurashikiensis]